jgi:hypothetical protein
MGWLQVVRRKYFGLFCLIEQGESGFSMEYIMEYTHFSLNPIRHEKALSVWCSSCSVLSRCSLKSLMLSVLVGIKNPATLWKVTGSKMEPPVRVELTT